MLIQVKSIVKTCESNPAQWEGTCVIVRDADQELDLLGDYAPIEGPTSYIYIRYRWGQLELGLGDNSIEEAVQDLEAIWSEGEGLDGEMTFDQLVELTKDTIDWRGLTGDA